MAGEGMLAEVRDVVERYCEAIRTQDEAEFRALWVGEATDALISQSRLFRGTDAIARDFLGSMLTPSVQQRVSFT